MENDQINSVIKITGLILLIIFLPRIIGSFEKIDNKDGAENFMFGVHNFIASGDYAADLKNKVVGLVLTDDPCDNVGRRTHELLALAGWKVDQIIKLPSSLAFQENESSLRYSGTSYEVFSVDALEGKKWDRFVETVDIFIVDIQPVGMRWDNLVPRLTTLLRAASEEKKKIILLDRPNPLGGRIEGPGEIPLRYGLSAGEMAHYINKNILADAAQLKVVPLKGWGRFKTVKENVVLDSQVLARYYLTSLLGLFKEISPFSLLIKPEKKLYALLWPEGNGLTDWEISYIKDLTKKIGLLVQPCHHMDESTGKGFKGLCIQKVMKIYKFSLINTFLTMVRFFSIRKNASMVYSENFDAMIGTDEVRKYFQGKATLDTLKLAVEKDLFRYYEKAKECFLYNPNPTLSKLYVRKGNRDK